LFKESWVGINTDYTGRPGTSNMTNSTRIFKTFSHLAEEEERSHLFVKILDTLRNIEAEFPLLISTNSDPKARTAQNFYQHKKQDLNGNLE
jgi:hypothetical protein